MNRDLEGPEPRPIPLKERVSTVLGATLQEGRQEGSTHHASTMRAPMRAPCEHQPDRGKSKRKIRTIYTMPTARPAPASPTSTVEQSTDGTWLVRDSALGVLAEGLSNEAAWREFDRLDEQGSGMEAVHREISIAAGQW